MAPLGVQPRGLVKVAGASGGRPHGTSGRAKCAAPRTCDATRASILGEKGTKCVFSSFGIQQAPRFPGFQEVCFPKKYQSKKKKKKSGAYIPCQFDLLHHLPVSLFRVGRGFWSGLDLLRQASCLSVCSPLPVSGHRRSGGKRGCQEGEWRAKPVLTQHLKPPHKYRLPFPISKAAPSTSVYTLARRSVSCAGGVSLKMTAGHLAEARRRGRGFDVLASSTPVRRGEERRAGEVHAADDGGD